LRNLLRNLKQPGPIATYVNEFTDLIGQIDDMGELDKVVNFTDGLKEPLRRELLKQRPDTLAESILIAENTHDALQFGEPTSYVNEIRTKANGNSTAMELDNVERYAPNHRQQRNSEQSVQRCYNCSGFGHIARNCSSPRRDRPRPTPFRHRQDRRTFSNLEAKVEIEGESGKEESQ
jgi:uncharacterized protein YerC